MKKQKVILILIVVLLIGILIPIVLNNNAIHRKNEAYKLELSEKEKEKQMLEQDEIAPILILNQDKITVYQGDEINYVSFIKEASDNLEGDLTFKVKCPELTSNEVGEYFVDYEVSDSASNVTKARLKVIIKEKTNFKY